MIELVDRVYRFRSRTGVGTTYLIEVAVDVYGVVTVRSVRSEQSGAVGYVDAYGCDCPTDLPAELTEDLRDAVDMARVLSQTYVVWAGRVAFHGEAYQRVDITGAVSTALYLVGATAANGVAVAATDRTQTGFILRPVAQLGTIVAPVWVDVFVVQLLVPSAPLAGEVVFRYGEPQTQRVNLTPLALPAPAYRVIVDPVGAFPVRVARDTNYFDVTIGAAVRWGTERRVRYGVVLR